MKRKIEILIALILTLTAGVGFTSAVYPIYEHEKFYHTTAIELRRGQIETVIGKLRKYAGDHYSFDDDDARLHVLNLNYELAMKAYHQNDNEKSMLYFNRLANIMHDDRGTWLKSGRKTPWWSIKRVKMMNQIAFHAQAYDKTPYNAQAPNYAKNITRPRWEVLFWKYYHELEKRDPHNLDFLFYVYVQQPDGLLSNNSKRSIRKQILNLNKSYYLDPLAQLTPDELQRLETFRNHLLHE